MSRYRREITHNHDTVLPRGDPTKEAENTLLRVTAIDPFKPGGVKVRCVESRFGPIEMIEVLHPLFDPSMGPILK